MRRWNGWGDDAKIYPLPASATQYLERAIGEVDPFPDASFKQVLSTVPASRLAPHPLINTTPAERLLHARGQSLPDWVALRSGQIEVFPDGVAYPTNDEDVRSLLKYARQADAHLIPYGGGTSVVGHINPLPSDQPTLTVDMSHLNKLIDLDETSRLATFEAGVTGPSLEEELRKRGYILGHFPQSWEFSTLGGWIATRSSGQQSYYYGRVEDFFAGGHLETPIGPLTLPPLPASAAGPDLREMILGSEGRLGIITRATIRVQSTPEVERFYAAFFRDWETGVKAVRAVAQSDLPLSMLRLSNPQETETTLMLAGRERLVSLAERGLGLLGYGDEPCMLIYGLTGFRGILAITRWRVGALLRSRGALLVGKTIGEMWRKSRFYTPYMRNTLWERGYAVDTLETAVSWASVLSTSEAILAALQDGLKDLDERALVFAHLSHMYRDGASIYVTFIFRRATDPGETLLRWQRLKMAASETIVRHGGTISHQHGVGTDHAPYLAPEKGEVGMSMLEAVRQRLDPEGLLNPGKLLGDI
ncbi:MAG TPA: FAD-binding oxidoreductase [Anaerolineae bacterium]|nr:FAD-binding oxidoreductase [Anaerolineae bacterium]